MLSKILIRFKAFIYFPLGQGSCQGGDQPRSITGLGWVNMGGLNHGHEKDLSDSSHPTDAL
jgi:hypothetical protein